MARPFAALDVDGSIFKSSLAELIVAEGIRAGLFDAAAFAKADEYRRRWQHDNNEGVYQAYLHHLVGAFVSQMAGVEVVAFEAMAHRAIREHGIRRFGFPRRLIEAVADTHHIIAISGSPDVLVRPLLEDLGVHAIYGSRFEVVDGRFTGRAEPVGDKAAIIERLIAEGVVERAGSIALGDTISDVGMLAIAEHPIMFNASRTLTNRGAAEHWPRVNEVKDQVTVLAYDQARDGYVEQSVAALMANVTT